MGSGENRVSGSHREMSQKVSRGRARRMNFDPLGRMCLVALMVGVAGCGGISVPSGVDSLPYFKIDRSTGDEVSTVALCRLYSRYGFVSGSCGDNEWVAKKLAEDELASDERRSARNEVQHAILGLATSRCNEFKQSLAARARGQSLGSDSLALLLSAGAAFAGGEKLTKGLAAGAGAATGFSRLMEDGYANQLETALLGIEIARTRIFLKILAEQKNNLLDYPLGRAVNDALRYHSVCNLTEGISEASRALSEELAEDPEGDEAKDDEENGSNQCTGKVRRKGCEA